MSAPDDLEPVLEAAEIQGNILGGFNKDHQAVIPLFFEVDATAKVREWLAHLATEGQITWLPEVVAFRREMVERTAAEGREPPDLLRAVWTSIALSYPGLRKLTPEADGFEPSFKQGLPAAVGILGDPLQAGVPGHIDGWLFGARASIPDVLAIIAADLAEDLEARVEAFLTSARSAGLRAEHFDIGHDLSHFGEFPKGREHFGFKDGVSQPGVRGRLSEDQGSYLTIRKRSAVDTAASPSGPEFSAPGQPLVCVGEFVLGYPRQSDAFGRRAAAQWRLGPRPFAPDQRAVAPWWGRNGSFLVYRRLRQDVPAFNRFLVAEAARLAESSPSLAGLDAHRLGAMVVGRWRSGAPLLRSLNEDNEQLGNSDGPNNAFDFEGGLDPADGFGAALADPEGRVCPQAAHIRKVNPRDLNTDQFGENSNLTRRLLRRGIPYGPPLPIGATKDLDPKRADRGLLFLSYQASIKNQFEFLTSTWTNSPSKPTPQFSPPPGAGHDIIMGQRPGDDRRRWILIGAERVRVDTPTTEWVTPTGGGYFFAPSRSAILDVLAASP